MLNQFQSVSAVPKSLAGLVKHGTCTSKCNLNTDVVYPKDTLTLSVFVDNTQCKKPIVSYSCTLLRRLEVLNLKHKKKPVIHSIDFVLNSEEKAAKCDVG